MLSFQSVDSDFHYLEYKEETNFELKKLCRVIINCYQLESLEVISVLSGYG
jgi:hypothetical protein